MTIKYIISLIIIILFYIYRNLDNNKLNTLPDKFTNLQSLKNL